MELFVMAATVSHARQLQDAREAEAAQAVQLANVFCRESRRRVRRLFQDLWRNDDAGKNQLAASVMKGEHAWLEEGRLDMELTPDDFKTRSITQPRVAEPELKRTASS